MKQLVLHIKIVLLYSCLSHPECKSCLSCAALYCYLSPGWLYHYLIKGTIFEKNNVIEHTVLIELFRQPTLMHTFFIH